MRPDSPGNLRTSLPALGIAFDATVFGVFDALMFAGRPCAAPDEIVQVSSRHTQEVDS